MAATGRATHDRGSGKFARAAGPVKVRAARLRRRPAGVVVAPSPP